MIYVNLAGFLILSCFTGYYLVKMMRREKRFWRDPEFWGMSLYLLTALDYLQAILRSYLHIPVGIAEQRSLNLLFGLTLGWTVFYTLVRRGYIDGVFSRLLHR